MAGEWLMFFDRDDAADVEDSNLQTGFVHGDLTVDQIADLLIRAEIDPQLLSNDQLDRLLRTGGQLDVSGGAHQSSITGRNISSRASLTPTAARTPVSSDGARMQFSRTCGGRPSPAKESPRSVGGVVDGHASPRSTDQAIPAAEAAGPIRLGVRSGSCPSGN